MSRPEIFIVNRDLDPLRAELERRFPDLAFGGVREADEFPEGPLQAEILLTWRVLPEWIPRLPRLKWVHCGGAGVDRVVFTPGLAPDVAITRTHGNFGRQMAEYALSAILHHEAGWPRWQAQQAARKWERPGRTLIRDRRAGVMGMGVIGTEVAELLSVAGLEVWGWSRSGRPNPACARALSAAGLDEFLSRLDYLIITLPLTRETRGLLDARRLALLPRGAVLINIARAPIVDEEALQRALEAGHLNSCYLDVFWQEPLEPSNPWWNRERAFITPHIAGVTQVGDLAHEFSENLERYLDGRPLHSLVDRARGY